VTTSPFFASQYVEANFQYKAYLDFLKKEKGEDAYKKALPNEAIWSKMHFSEEEIAYLKKNYYQDKWFEAYPVLGLDYTQISAYLEWKTEKRNEAILLFYKKTTREKIKKEGFRSADYFKKYPKLVQPSYRIPTYAGALACIKKAEQEGDRDDEPRGIPKTALNTWIAQQPDYAFLVMEGLTPVPSRTQKEEVLFLNLLESGIVSIYSTDFTDILDYPAPFQKLFSSYKLYELTQGISKEQADTIFFNHNGQKGYSISIKKAAAINYVTQNGKLIETNSKLIEEEPLATFRTHTTNIHKNKSYRNK
jgi:hypothetical protein